MKELIKQYLDDGMSRRQLMTGLSALGMSTVAAKSVAQSLAPVAGRQARRPCARCKAPAGRCSSHSSRRPASNTCSSIRRPAITRSSTRWSMNPASRSSRASRKAPSSPWRTAMRELPGKPGDRHRRQCRPAQRHDADGQQLEGPDSAAGRGRLGRTRTRSAASRLQETEFHDNMTVPITKWTWVGAHDHGGHPRNAAARPEIRLDPAGRTGVPVAARTTRCANRARPRSGTRPSSTCRCISAPTRTTSRRRRARCSKPRTR